ncbi:penicillin-binding protein 2 [Patescibacteria group bacterium]|nr:penicillin-binding protein 2 [Patescibacteria group bacterium]
MKAPYHPDPFEYHDNRFTGRDEKLERKYGHEWEETLVDTGAAEPHKIRPLFNLVKMKWLFAFVSILIVVLMGRLFQLQVVLGKTFESEANKNRYRIQIVKAPRGVIYDRNKALLVNNLPQFDVAIVPADFPQKSDDAKINDIKEVLKSYIDLNDQHFESVVKELNYGSYIPVTLAENVERDSALLIESELYNLPGITIEKIPIRNYSYPEDFSHVLGYIGRINEKEVRERERTNEAYLPNDLVGKAGLELSYEDVLRGTYGKRQVEVDSHGKVKKVLATQDPKPGHDIVLSIDKDLQMFVRETLVEKAREHGSSKASAVGINPQTGEVYFFVTIPSYDNNLFTRGISSEDYNTLLEDENKPLVNRALNGVYPPGSIVKPVMALAGLEEGVITDNTTILDEGKILVPNKYNPDIVYQFVSWNLSGLGPMNVYNAIAKSSDIFFYYVGGGFEDFEGLGADKIREYYELFSFGSKTGIDLPGESTGLIPTTEWKEEVKKETWYLGDTYHLAIGQGDLLITPLQAAVFTAAIANGGTMYTPKILKKTYNPEDNTVHEFQPNSVKENVVNKGNVAIVKKAMRETVLSGSAKELQGLPVPVAGKTGTAQFANNTKTHAWFTAFAPYENPTIAIAVIIEGGGGGQDVAVPVANEILQWYFENSDTSMNTP